MTVTYGDNMSSFAVEKFKSGKNEFLYNYPTKIKTVEYIAPVTTYKGRRATFQAAMKATILIGQCFGLNPVLGVCEIDTSKLRFTFYSGRCFYSLVSILGQTVVAMFCVLKLFKDTNASLSSNISIVFFGTNTLTTVLFVRIAKKWPKVCQKISVAEAADPSEDTKLIRRCNISCILILSLAALEHMLSDLSGMALAIDCQPDKTLVDAFFLQGFPFIWMFVPFNILVGVFAKIINIQCAFNWNFADVFVICISWYLISRLEQVNNRINAVRGKSVSSSFWRTMREDYSRATSLVRKLDDVISGIIFISFANNLFFICLQLLNTLEEGIKATPACHSNLDARPFHGYEQAVYFVYSFIFLLGRSLSVSLIAARVHTASLEPAQVLYDVPSTAYCQEVQRFLDQVHSDTVALSGLQFFNVKRGLVLTIAGTVVTYELVLMQFAGVTPTASPPLISSLSIPTPPPS